MAAVIVLVESFTWVDNSNAGKDAMNSRYNGVANNGHTFVINVGGGRFAGNCLQLAGDSFYFQPPKGSMGPDVVFGFAVMYPGSVVGTNNQTFNLFETPAGNDEQVSLRMNPAGQVRITRLGTTLATGTTVIQSGVWYYFEWAVHLDPAAGSSSLWINGALEATVSGVNTQPRATNKVNLFALSNFANARMCDLYAIDGGLVNLGPQRVSLKLATADGTNLDWTPSTGATQFNLVNTVPPATDTNGWIESNTPGDKSTFAFGPLPYVPVSIAAVQVGFYSRFDDGGPHLVAPVVVSGATTNIGTPQSVQATYLDIYLQVYQTDPNTGLAWTAAHVDAAQYGVDLNT